ncbi:MAG: hypothetical protein EOO27_50660, partial [Comamonadaceae bacterium]
MSDGAGQLGGSVAARNETAIALVNGLRYDFSFDARTSHSGGADAGVLKWVILNMDNSIATVLSFGASSAFATNGNGAATAAGGSTISLEVDGSWTRYETLFENVLPTGNYKIAMTFAIGGADANDLQVDRVFLGPAMTQTVLPSIPPVALDLNGDGDINYGRTWIDIDGDGRQEHSAWVSEADGVLVWNKYGDAVVHDSSQYSFAQYGAAGATDLTGLAAKFDTNADSLFDARDELFAEFSVWQDSNGNGVSDAGEVRTLASVGITSIGLLSDGIVARPAEGVVEAGRTRATMVDGSMMVVADV